VKIVPNRETETLQEVIERHVARGTLVKTDGWKAYETVQWDQLGMEHKVTCHNFNQNGTTNFANSYAIEGLWGELKPSTLRVYN